MPDEPTEPTGADDTDDKPEPTPEPTELGEGGKKALEAERKARRDAEARLKELEPLAAKAKELEDSSKSEIERATEKLTDAERRANDAEARALRIEVAAEKGIPLTQAKRLVGATREELEADADEYLEANKGPEKPSGRPKERLTPGAVPDADTDGDDPRELAKKVRRY